MNKFNKKSAIIINIAFLISYIYFFVFYSQGTFIKIQLPSKLMHFLFQSESGMIPLAIVGLCTVIVSICAFDLKRMSFSKPTVIMCGASFIPALAPVMYNLFFGPIVDEKGDVLWLTATVILLIYFIVFQIFFIRDYKRLT